MGSRGDGWRAGLRKKIEVWLALGLMTRRLVFELFVLSVLRYFVIMVQILLISKFAGFSFASADLVATFPLVQITQIAAITPGGLGVTEWTWVGLLAFFEYDLTEAGNFALTSRILIFGVVVFATVLSGVVFVVDRRSVVDES